MFAEDDRYFHAAPRATALCHNVPKFILVSGVAHIRKRACGRIDKCIPPKSTAVFRQSANRAQTRSIATRACFVTSKQHEGMSANTASSKGTLPINALDAHKGPRVSPASPASAAEWSHAPDRLARPALKRRSRSCGEPAPRGRGRPGAAPAPSAEPERRHATRGPRLQRRRASKRAKRVPHACNTDLKQNMRADTKRMRASKAIATA